MQTTRTEDALGGVREYAYDPVTKKTISSVDELGRVSTYAYDARGNKIGTIFPDGTTQTALFQTINDVECLTQSTDKAGRITRFEYDTEGNNIAVIDPAGNITRKTYTPTGKIATSTDNMGNMTKFTYNKHGGLSSTEDAAGNLSTISYDTVGNIISQSDSSGHITSHEYDDNRRIIKTTLPPDALGRQGISILNYDQTGQVVSSTNPLGYTTRQKYNSQGQLLSSIDALGNVTSQTYDIAGRLKTQTDAKGNTTTYNYDELDRMVSTKDALGKISSSSLDIAGRRIATIDSDGNATFMVYDSINNWINEIHHPDGMVENFEYNVLGQKTAAIDSSGRRTEFEYDSLGRQSLQRKFLDGQPLITSFEYDTNGNQIKTIDVMGRETISIYSKLNQLQTKIQPSPDGTSPGPVTSREYNALGQLVKLIKPNGAEWCFGFDALGHMIWKQDPSGFKKTYEYDLQGNLVTKTDAKGQKTTYEYDYLSRLIRVDYTDGEWVTMAYDSNSNRTRISGGSEIIGSTDIIISQSFDELDRVTTIGNSSLQRQLSYCYTPNGHRDSMTITNLVDGSQKTTKFLWDEMGRVKGIQPWTGELIAYTYTPDGSRSTVNLPNNLSLNYTYDSLGRLVGLEYADGNSAQIASFTYILDFAGNKISMNDNEGITQFSYDNLDRLVTASYPDGTFEHFKMDLAGRRTLLEDQDGITKYQYDISDKLLSTSGTKPTTYTWDLNGNLVSKITPQETITYTWNANNKLISVNQPGGATNTYRYYPYSVHRYSMTNSNGISKKFLYERRNVVQEVDDYNGEIANYIEGLGIDQHIAMIIDGNTFAYVTDLLGTVRNIVDSSGQILNSYNYKAYGETRHVVESIDNSFLFTGHRLDANTGEYYCRARYYQAANGIFTALDPLAPRTQSYSYTGGNPISRKDKTGLAWTHVGSNRHPGNYYEASPQFASSYLNRTCNNRQNTWSTWCGSTPILRQVNTLVDIANRRLTLASELYTLTEKISIDPMNMDIQLIQQRAAEYTRVNRWLGNILRTTMPTHMGYYFSGSATASPAIGVDPCGGGLKDVPFCFLLNHEVAHHEQREDYGMTEITDLDGPGRGEFNSGYWFREEWATRSELRWANNVSSFLKYSCPCPASP